MIIKVKKSDLLPLLSKAQSLVEKRTSLQTLLNVLIEASQKETSMEIISKNKYIDSKKENKTTREGAISKTPQLSLGSLKIFSTNLEVGFVGETRVFVHEPIRMAVHAKSFFEVIRGLPKEEIILVSKKNHWLQVQQENSVFNIAGISPESFPDFPQFKESKFVSLDPLVLKTMIEKTLYCVSIDDTRRHLNGVFFEKLSRGERSGELSKLSKKNRGLRVLEETQKPQEGGPSSLMTFEAEEGSSLEKLEQKEGGEKEGNGEGLLQAKKDSYRMVAMSTHRLSFVEREIENPLLEKLENGVIIPKKGLLELNLFLDEAVQKGQLVEFFVDETQVVIHLDKSFLMIHLINDRYPNYRRLVPQNMKNEVVLSRRLFLDSLRRVAILCHRESGFVSLNFKDGKLELKSGDTELGSAKEELDVLYQGESVSIGFNINYIMETLKSMQDEEVSLTFTDSLSPGIIQPLGDASYTSVIMPMSFPNL